MSERLRSYLQTDASQSDKALAVLGFVGRPSSLADIRSLAAENGLRMGAGWNLATSLRRTKGLAINTTKGWELTESGRARLASLALSGKPQIVTNTLNALRVEVARIGSDDTKRFLTEAIECIENGHHRAAVIMSWVAAVHVLQDQIFHQHLAAFNAEAMRRDGKWRPAKTLDGISRMKEADFLDVTECVGLIGKNVKTELKGCLDRRNSCGHPNSYKLKELTVAHHVEILILNVFARF